MIPHGLKAISPEEVIVFRIRIGSCPDTFGMTNAQPEPHLINAISIGVRLYLCARADAYRTGTYLPR
ncbi:hypothetical protein GMOD_00002182 [Pyrenophora seminiperda CCB06]|uniref:Uncharacterized protein n=1 Tax=Pyrenophora seminiperda CCB06 TaxID=1302712 RepID=A0A3M7LX72_9PLEO|nr:hypothetical protein GMOD_00002182 [Pyrenophora seminiperda CCB06]